jgi:hypothetical protein
MQLKMYSIKSAKLTDKNCENEVSQIAFEAILKALYVLQNLQYKTSHTKTLQIPPKSIYV